MEDQTPFPYLYEWKSKQLLIVYRTLLVVNECRRSAEFHFQPFECFFDA